MDRDEEVLSDVLDLSVADPEPSQARADETKVITK